MQNQLARLIYTSTIVKFTAKSKLTLFQKETTTQHIVNIYGKKLLACQIDRSDCHNQKHRDLVRRTYLTYNLSEREIERIREG